jgi:N-acetylglucosaminyldiphosphoundecaprenol N-acetyl-beta-D-mannosaminyltransferase
MGARLLGTPLPERLPVPDWIDDLMGSALTNAHSLFLLGASEAVVEAAEANLKGRYPQLKIVGSHHGYFDKIQGSPENLAVVQHVLKV